MTDLQIKQHNEKMKRQHMYGMREVGTMWARLGTGTDFDAPGGEVESFGGMTNSYAGLNESLESLTRTARSMRVTCEVLDGNGERVNIRMAPEVRPFNESIAEARAVMDRLHTMTDNSSRLVPEPPVEVSPTDWDTLRERCTTGTATSRDWNEIIPLRNPDEPVVHRSMSIEPEVEAMRCGRRPRCHVTETRTLNGQQTVIEWDEEADGTQSNRTETSTYELRVESASYRAHVVRPSDRFSPSIDVWRDLRSQHRRF